MHTRRKFGDSGFMMEYSKERINSKKLNQKILGIFQMS